MVSQAVPVPCCFLAERYSGQHIRGGVGMFLCAGEMAVIRYVVNTVFIQYALAGLGGNIL